MKRNFLLVFSIISIFSAQAQVGIGTENPDVSSILDIASTNKGVLYPRVALTSATDQVTIATPARGLMVYNTGANAGFSQEGYMYWNGEEWRLVYNLKVVAPQITNLQCGSATLIPSQYSAGVPYVGTMTVPYIGGNGGQYSAGIASAPVNGLTATLQGGILSVGSGSLRYTVQGTPIGSSPTVLTTFPITFAGISCSATVGVSTEVKTIQYVRNTVPINASTPTASVTTLGSVSIRYNTTTTGSGNWIEFNLTTPNQVTGFGQVSGAGGNFFASWLTTSAAANFWYKATGQGLTAANRDTYNLTLSLHNSLEIYRVSVVANANIAASTSAAPVGAPNPNVQVPSVGASVTIFIEKLE